jgi:hypothetical protein
MTRVVNLKSNAKKKPVFMKTRDRKKKTKETKPKATTSNQRTTKTEKLKGN